MIIMWGNYVCRSIDLTGMCWLDIGSWWAILSTMLWWKLPPLGMAAMLIVTSQIVCAVLISTIVLWIRMPPCPPLVLWMTPMILRVIAITIGCNDVRPK